MVFANKDNGSGSDAEGRGPRGDAALTIIAAGTTVTGEVHSNGVVKVEGEVVGTVGAERQVLVARGGRVEGDVRTRDAVLGGEVHGAVVAHERVEVQTGSVVNGDITTQRLVVQEGGEVNGQVNMGEPVKAPQRPEPEHPAPGHPQAVS